MILGKFDRTISAFDHTEPMTDKLPFRIRFERRKAYGVSSVSGFKNPDDIGECDPNAKQIKIKASMSEYQTIATLLHECVHLCSFEKELELTENQVLGIEEGLIKIFILNQDFLKLFYKTLLKRKVTILEK